MLSTSNRPLPHTPTPALLLSLTLALALTLALTLTLTRLVEYADYEKPLPSGWKEGGWSTDGFGEYDMGSAGQLKPQKPPQPAPYQGVQGGRSGSA